MKLSKLIGYLMVLGTAVVFTNCANQNMGPSALKRVHFDFDKSYIRSDMIPVMNGNASYLKKNAATKVVVEGHCDERGTNEYNMALGQRRAESAKNYLVSQGVNPSRLKTISFGEERPLQKGSGESVWYMNRRAEFDKN